MNTIIRNGKILVEGLKFVESVYIENGTIIKASSNEEIAKYQTEDTQVIDAKSNLVLPGFNDSHMHLLGVGKFLSSVNCYGATTINEVIEKGKEFIENNNIPSGSVVTGRGWNQDYFVDENRLLNRHDLDLISKEHPIILKRACGHLVTCNTKALETAGINEHTSQVSGGIIEHEESGYPSGVFSENAIKLLDGIMPESSVDMLKNELKLAVDHAIKHGLTSVQTNDLIDGENDFDFVIDAYKELAKTGELKLRVDLQCCFDKSENFQKFIDKGYYTGFGDDYFKIGPLKLFVDGSLGARTAHLRSTYADDNTTSGVSCMSQDRLDEMVKLANKNKFQVVVHAIGDRAISNVLQSYENVICDGKNELRHGIIHCQITDYGILERFKKNNVFAYVQPIFLHYDLHIVEDRVGKELASTSYAFQTMENLGIKVGYGTDAPIEDLNPFECIHCAVNRQDLKGYPENGFYSNESVSIETAIKNYTIGSAYASFDENIKGTLKEGMKADLIILNQDLYEIDRSKIIDTEVLLTMIDGNVVYKK